MNNLKQLSSSTYVFTLSENAYSKCSFNPKLDSLIMLTTVKYNKIKDAMFDSSNEYWRCYVKNRIFIPLDIAAEKYSYNNVNIFGNLADNWLVFKINQGGKADANVLLCCENDEYNELICRMNVQFTKTSDGWRISGGQLVNAMCDKNNVKYEVVCPQTQYYNIAKDIVYYQMGLAGFTIPHAEFTAQVTELSAEKVKITLKMDYNDGTTAYTNKEFTAIFDVSPKNPDDYFMNCHSQSENYPSESTAFGEEKYTMHLVGGTIYDLIYSKISPNDLTDTPVKNGNNITDSEAWDLITKAFCLIIDGQYWYSTEDERVGYDKLPDYYKVYKKYNTVGKMSEYARTIFVPSIADSSWRYDLQFGNLVWDYSKDASTPICPVSYMMMGHQAFLLWKNSNDSSLPTAKEAMLTKISDNNGIAEYSIRMYCGDTEVGTATPGLVKVRFMNTENGWRIANCDFFKALTGAYSIEGAGVENLSPSTGDADSIMSIVVISSISVIALVGLFLCKRKRERTE